MILQQSFSSCCWHLFSFQLELNADWNVGVLRFSKWPGSVQFWWSAHYLLLQELPFFHAYHIFGLDETIWAYQEEECHGNETSRASLERVVALIVKPNTLAIQISIFYEVCNVLDFLSGKINKRGSLFLRVLVFSHYFNTNIF